MNASLLNKDEYSAYFKNYIDQAGTVDLITGLQEGLDKTIAFYRAIPSDKLLYTYQDGKWTIKEILNHLLDSERVFCYRAMRFAREDTTALPGFEENDYAVSSQANNRSIEDLIKEYASLRKSTLHLFNSFTPAMLIKQGVAGGGTVSVRALGFLIIGHEKHHKTVIESRYL